MKLFEAKIHNFKGIIDQTINFQDYALLVGANNSGKSSTINAIRAFYEKDGFKYKKESDFPLKGASDNESWIDLLFNLTDSEYDSLASEYQVPEKILKVRKYFQTEEKLHDGKSANGWILGYKTDGSLDNKPFYGAKNVQSGKFGDLIFIPAVSKVDEHTKLSGPSAMRDLITNIMSDVVEESTAYKELNKNAFQITEDDWQRIVDSNQAFSLIAQKYPKLKKSTNEEDLKPEIEALKYSLWLNPARASMFFANFVLLVEGPTETALINKLIDDHKIKTPTGAFILDTLGKYNIHRFMNLLSALGIQHSVIHDDDDDKGVHLELNQLISDSKTEKTGFQVKRIPGDIEGFLGIKKSLSPHSKPQHILYLYSNKSISEEKLSNFCSIAEECFPNT